MVRKGNKATVELSREHADQLIKAALGLTLSEAENAFAKAIAHDGKLGADDIKRIQDEKRQVIRKSGLLEYYPPDETLGNVGGLSNLKAWLSQRTSRLRRAGPPVRPARAPGRAAAGRAGLRQEPHRQGHLRARGTCRCCGSTWGASSAGWSARRRRTCARPSAWPRASRPWCCGWTRSRRGCPGVGSSEHGRQRRVGARLRHPAHLAAGEDRAGVRGGHRQPHRRPAAGAAAQGALRRDLLRRSARAGRAPGDLPHPPAAAQARAARTTIWTRWPR